MQLLNLKRKIMTKIKSFSVGNGDMFYIKHNSDNFSIIDCCLSDDNKEDIVNELKNESKDKGITRFISTHPDEDHIERLNYLDDEISIVNFYCVKNEATKNVETDGFKRYCKLRDGSYAFNIYKNCSRRWMNQSDNERDSAGITILWPDTTNNDFKDALKEAKDGGSPNNISPIIQYSLQDGVRVLWMGDLNNEFMEKIKDKVTFEKAHILFAPHHGRKSGSVIKDWLDKIKPEIIVVGEAPSKDLEYYQGYNTITQNSAGDIIFDCVSDKVHIYVSNENYSVDYLDDEKLANLTDHYYIGTLKL